MTDSIVANSLTSSTAVTCDNCNLGNLCIPKGLNRSEIDALELLVNRNTLIRKGAALYHAGSPFKGILALRSGSAKLIHHDRSGHEFIVDFTLPGELLGFDGLTSLKYNCTAIALETVNFCRLPEHKIAVLANNSPSLSHVLLQRSSSQCDQQVQHMLLNRRSAEERVAGFILRLSERLKARGYAELEFRLSMSREDIGNYLGIAHETVSRIMHYFQAQQLIEIKSKHLKIKNKKKLLDFYSV
ncbi:MAG: helix-turn-helix domain-containing protein [Methylococcaceae bacterium]|nr:helix-turn-helix domain-containing protein [Methylococcaceae bacterium]